ncbi:MAG: protein kinase [Actinomycetia bacterium]|nr:protein kinase [Actinomycetes bacterium]MCP4960521.1 protein kinase [Actinomycetes bacterium]
MDKDLIARVLPNYDLGDEIGRGGWGVVYRAFHPSLQRHVAVKVLPRALGADVVTRDRFLDEARLGAMLDHPHIVKVYDFIEHEGVWLIVMDRLGGGTLWERFSSQGLMSDEVCAIALGLCAALEAAHEREIIHRDVKPENILFTDDLTPCLADFGIAKALDFGRAHTAAGEVVGTPAYMSPEQARGVALTPESDVYSAGVLLYESLSGVLPFPDTEEPMAVLLKHVNEPPPDLKTVAPQVPAEIAEVVMRCLEKDPKHRFRSGGALGEAIAQAANAAFGIRWLNHTGIGFRAWGPIAETLARPTQGPPQMRTPTTSKPAVKDHMRAGTTAESPAPKSHPIEVVDMPPASPEQPMKPVDRADDSPRPTPEPLRITGNATKVKEPGSGPPKLLLGVGTVAVLLAALLAAVYFIGGRADDDTTAPPTTVAESPMAIAADDVSAADLDQDALSMANRYTDRCRSDGGVAAECLCQFLVLVDYDSTTGLSTPVRDILAEYETSGEVSDEVESLLEGRCESRERG